MAYISRSLCRRSLPAGRMHYTVLTLVCSSKNTIVYKVTVLKFHALRVSCMEGTTATLPGCSIPSLLLRITRYGEVCQPLFARFSADFVKVKKPADHAFMTLPPYTRTREGEDLSRVAARNPAGWAFELGNALEVHVSHSVQRKQYPFLLESEVTLFSMRLKVVFATVFSCLALVLCQFSSTGVASAHSTQALRSQTSASALAEDRGLVQCRTYTQPVEKPVFELQFCPP